MPEITLTEFVDFATKVGSSKLTVAKDAKKRRLAKYDPKKDFYKRIRDGIVQYHRDGRDHAFLERLSSNVRDPNKVKIYPQVIAAYQKFLGRKQVNWFEPPKKHWSYQDLDIIVNPELGLEFKGRKHLIKLYFKEPDAEVDGSKPRLTKRHFNMLSHLMYEGLKQEADGSVAAFLDVRNSRLHVFDAPDPGLAVVLEAEALAFCRMYEG